MAKDLKSKFPHIKSKVEQVANTSDEKANVTILKKIRQEDLVDHPLNDEDISYTEDLEISMKEHGFTSPLEVTTYGAEEGKYFIVSGHRRRAAARKVGFDILDCHIKDFSNDIELFDYLLSANAHRNTDREPMLLIKRYLQYEKLLDMQEFKGSKGERKKFIADKMGVSEQHVERYKALTKLIPEIIALIKEEVVGASSVVPVATLSLEQQKEVYIIFKEYIEKGISLTRPECKKIVDAYKEGKRSYDDINKTNIPTEIINNDIKDSGIPLNATMNTEPSQKEPAPRNRNDEVRPEYDPVLQDTYSEHTDKLADERLTTEDYEVINNTTPIPADNTLIKETEEDKRVKKGTSILNTIDKLTKDLNDDYIIEDPVKGVESMGTFISIATDEMYEILLKNEVDQKFLVSVLNDLEKKINNLKSLI